MSERRRSLVRRHAKWCVPLASLLLGVLLGEMIIRIVHLAPPVHAIWVNDEESFYQRSTNPILNYEIKPDLVRDLSPGVTTSNVHGRRDKPRTLAKAPGVRRILFLGDSVVEGINYVSDTNTITRRLEDLYPDGRTEILNFGTSGYCTLAEVELLRTAGLRFQPDVVVLLFVVNDFNNFNPEHTTDAGIIDRPIWSKHLFVRSHLYRHLALKFDWFGFATEADPDTYNRMAIGSNNVVAGLRRLRELANERGFRTLIVPWPVFADDSISYPDQSGTSELLIERLGRIYGLPVIPIAETFATAFDRLGESLSPREMLTVASDGMHPNALGAGMAAEILKLIIDSGLRAPPYERGPHDDDAVMIARTLAGPPRIQAVTAGQRHYRSLLYQDRTTDAEAYLQELVREDADHPWANFFLGRHLARHDQKYNQALPFLLTDLSHEPERVEARHLAAEVLSSQGKGDAAIKLLQEGLQRSPREPYLHYAIGTIAITNRQFELADRHLRTAAELAPKFEAVAEAQRQLETEIKPSKE